MDVSPERMAELIELIKSGNHLAFYSTYEWRKTRQKVKERDHNECQACKAQGRVFTDKSKPGKHKRLDCDHIKELGDYPELCLDMDNLVMLCIKCHNEKHGRYQYQEPKWNDERW